MHIQYTELCIRLKTEGEPLAKFFKRNYIISEEGDVYYAEPFPNKDDGVRVDYISDNVLEVDEDTFIKIKGKFVKIDRVEIMNKLFDERFLHSKKYYSWIPAYASSIY